MVIPYSREEWLKSMFTCIFQHVLGSSSIVVSVCMLRIQRAKSCFKKLEAPAEKKQGNHLFPCGMSSADVEESPGLQETRS